MDVHPPKCGVVGFKWNPSRQDHFGCHQTKCHGAAVLGVKGMTYRCDNVARTRRIWSKRYGYAKCWEAYQNVDRD
jgi:hypothetical protein